MNNKQITVNGYTFQVESTLDDDNCYRLYYGDALVLDDTAYEDYYGDINAVADIMGEQVREETEKPSLGSHCLAQSSNKGLMPQRLRTMRMQRGGARLSTAATRGSLPAPRKPKTRKNVLISTTRITLSTSTISSTGTPVISSWKKIIENSQPFSPTHHG